MWLLSALFAFFTQMKLSREIDRGKLGRVWGSFGPK